jgi:iron(III) transport system substrate-binding protein
MSGCAGRVGSELTVYTSVTQATVDAVVTGFEEANPDVTVEVFRAPTGEVAARIAAERRNGSLAADVLWLSDPLSMYQYQSDGLLAEWTPPAAAALPPEAQSVSFWGTRVLHLIIVVPAGNPAGIEEWQDLVDPTRAIAFPDPRFAGSAFAALGHFGLEFFGEMEAAGAIQVSSPGDVVTGVAEGRYQAGLTLEFSARTAADKGSPVEVVWPRPGAVAITSPVAIFDGDGSDGRARGFVEFVLSERGQAAIGATGWSPILAGVAGPPIPAEVDIVFPDWDVIIEQQEELIDGYASIFGG